LDALKGLEAARKYTCQFETKNKITVMCNKVKSELYKLRSEGENKQKTNWEILKDSDDGV
jgi:hypothetical protein